MDLCVNDQILKIKVNVNFKEGYNILLDNSSTGKTLLISLLSDYLKFNNIPYIKCDFSNMTLLKKAINVIEDSVKVILLDNADLYLTGEMIDRMLSVKDRVIIVSSKSIIGTSRTIYRTYYLTGLKNGEITSHEY